MPKRLIFAVLLLVVALSAFSSVSFAQSKNKTYPIDPKTEPLAAVFINNKPVYWTTDESQKGSEGYRRYELFLEIEPSKDRMYSTKKPGQVNGQEAWVDGEVSGLELRQLLVLFDITRLSFNQEKARDDAGKLKPSDTLISEETRKAYFKTLYGTLPGEKTPRNRTHKAIKCWAGCWK